MYNWDTVIELLSHFVFMWWLDHKKNTEDILEREYLWGKGDLWILEGVDFGKPDKSQEVEKEDSPFTEKSK